MKMRHNALGLSMLAAVAIAPVAEAQPTTSPVWAVHRAIKVKPGKATEFTEFYRTTIRRFHQARKDAGAQTGWSLTRLVVPSGEEAPYDYVSTTLHTRFPELDQSPADLAPFIEKAGTTPEKFVATLNEVSTLVRRTVSTGIDAVGMIEPGDYVRIDYMKVPPGKAGDYVNLERTIYKPLHEQRMKDGIISAWVLSAATLPGGSERPYEFFTRVLNTEEHQQMNELFDRLGHSDVTFVDATDVIAAWIGTRAQDVLAALDSKDFDTVERMIREAGQEAKGLRKNVAENWYALTELKAEFVAVSGAI